MDKVAVKKQLIIKHITHHMIDSGLSDLGLRRLADVAGTSDRMLIYYFGTKDALIGQVLYSIASNFALQLDSALGEHQRSPEELIEELLAINDTPQFNLIVRLWFEIVGLAARGQEPYAQNAAAIANDWIDWIQSRLVNPQVGQAVAVFAELEGRLMIKMIGADLS